MRSRRRSRSVQAIAAAWAVGLARAAAIVLVALLLVVLVIGPATYVLHILACALACAAAALAADHGLLPLGDYDPGPMPDDRPTTTLPPIDLPDRYR